MTAGELNPVPGNEKGSYLTFRSIDGNICRSRSLIRRTPVLTQDTITDAGISFTIGSATVFLDQSYWQRAIASNPKGTTRAYFLGGLSWFSVPFAFGTIMGLSARALQNSPVFPTYPEPLSTAQQGAGLVAPAAAVALLGQRGAIAMLIVTYMVCPGVLTLLPLLNKTLQAVTSATSAQLISVSSIFTYDVYRVRRPPFFFLRNDLINFFL